MKKADGQAAKLGPFRVQQVRGEPYVVGGRSLVPVARIVSLGKARATVGPERISGWAGGLSWITPVAVLVETPQGQQRIPIKDATAAAVTSLVIGAMVVVAVLAIVRCLARRWRALVSGSCFDRGHG
jgi:hypothetical protein